METHQLIKDYFFCLSEYFKEYFGEPNNKKLPFQKDTHEWLNFFYQSPLFRHIHLEFYKTDKICVLHVNTFPDARVDLPILGLDLIAIGNKITGLFFDYTPTFVSYSRFEADLDKLNTKYKSEKRPLPEWADFFSNNFYCIIPSQDELTNILTDVKDSVKNYLNLCRDERLKLNLRIEKQNKYCVGQKKNDKTYKALAVEIGEKNAKKFLNKFLFPEIN